MALEGGVLEDFMSVFTVTPHQLLAVKAIADVHTGLPTNAITDLASIADLSEAQNTQQTIVMKTYGLFVESICVRENHFCLTFGTAKLSISSACSCMPLQTVAAKCMQTSYRLRIGVSIQTLNK